MIPSHTLFIAAFAFYFAAFAGHLGVLVWRRSGWSRLARAAVWLGALWHGVGVGQLFVTSSHFPMSHPAETYAFFSFLVVLFHLMVSLRYSVNLLALFTLPLVQFLMLAAHLSSGNAEPEAMLVGYWLRLHVVLTFAAYGMFALAFVSALGYLVQDWELKSHRPGNLFLWMPDLQVLDEINTRALVVGFFTLSLGLLSGVLWAYTSHGAAAWLKDPKAACALLIWALYGGLLFLRVSATLRGRKVAWGSIAGFVFVVVSFIGISHTLVR